MLPKFIYEKKKTCIIYGHKSVDINIIPAFA
jgi:hypothetical protein